MNVTQPLKATVWEDCGLFLMARVLGNQGTAVTQDTVSSVSVTVTDQSDGTVTYAASPAVSGVVFNAAQTSDPRWTGGAAGYNFAVAVPGTAFPDGGHYYRVEVFFTPMSGSPFALACDVTAKDLLSRA